MPYFNIMFWRLMTHTTLGLIWLLKMNILRLLGSSDDKEKIGVARPEGPPLRGFRSSVQGTRIEETVKKSSQNEQDRDNLLSPVKPTLAKLYSSVHWTQKLRLGFCAG